MDEKEKVVIDPTKLSKEVTDKYTLENNALKMVAKDNPKDLVEAIIGDDKQPDTFYPQLKVQRWDNEANLSVRLIDDETTKPTVTTDKEKITWTNTKKDIKFYDLPISEEHPEGGYEFEITLKEPPKSNVIEFTLNDKDVEYFYQPPLTQEEVDGGASRPENVVGSYAVYAKTPKTNWTGGKEYKTGKLGHIFRPKIVDAEGTEIWGDLHIENGILSVTIPQEFLDNAVYPVRHAAGLTFGYTTDGGTTYAIAQNGAGTITVYRRGSVGSPASNGTLDNIKFYIGSNVVATANMTFTVFVNQKDSGGANSHGKIASAESNTSFDITQDGTLITTNLGNQSVTAGTNYIIDISGDGAGLQFFSAAGISGDTGGTSYYESFGTSYANSKEDPWTVSAEATGRTYSIYATYTTGGGTAVKDIIGSGIVPFPR